MKNKTMSKKLKARANDYPKSFETFRPIGDYTMRDMTQTEPSCFNGEVKIRKYKVTIEEVEEPIEVLRQRVQKLWDECDNMHHWRPLQEAAERLGYTLVCSAGNSLPVRVRI